jgi:hypothetical protein
MELCCSPIYLEVYYKLDMMEELVLTREESTISNDMARIG